MLNLFYDFVKLTLYKQRLYELASENPDIPEDILENEFSKMEKQITKEDMKLLDKEAEGLLEKGTGLSIFLSCSEDIQAETSRLLEKLRLKWQNTETTE